MRRARFVVVLLIGVAALGCRQPPATLPARAPEPAELPASSSPAPEAFVEAEAEPEVGADSADPATLALTLDDLVFELGVAPFMSPGGWAFVFETTVVHRGGGGTYDLGDEPRFSIFYSAEAPDGSGFGGATSCTWSSNLHGSLATPLGPGERLVSRQTWAEGGLGPGHTFEFTLSLCEITRPDGTEIEGELAVLEGRVGPDGQITAIELRRALP